jgi:hypothetical protein
MLRMNVRVVRRVAGWGLLLLALSCGSQSSTHPSGLCTDGGACSSNNNVCDGSRACGSDASTASCSSAADGTPCTGSDLCLTNYACHAGVCTGTSPVVCKAEDACHTAGTCDPTTGCSNPAIPGCNSTAASGYSPFETQASIIGLVQTAAGAAVTGTAVTVYDMPVSGPARTDVVVVLDTEGPNLDAVESMAGPLTSQEIEALAPTGDQRNLIDQLFKTGVDNPGITDDTLNAYMRLARNALDYKNNNSIVEAVQSDRLNLLEQIIQARQAACK